MTRFDAPVSSPSVPGSALRAASGVLAARLGLIVAAMVPTVLALIAAVLLLGLAAVVPRVLRQAFVSSPLLVFMTPTASRADVETLGTKLTALPDVASAAVRTKDDALAALVAAGLSAPADGRNPLPDVWTVTLQGTGPLFLTEAIATRDAIRALPSVDQVRFDEAWAGSLDHATATWARFGIGWLAGVSGGVAVALLCVYILFCRALTGPVQGRPVAVASLVIVGGTMVLVSALLGYALCLLILDPIGASAWPALKPIGEFLGLKLAGSIAAATVFCLVLLVIGIVCGRANDRNKQSF
jgi:hypothetical protein